jgi:VIT1/CCC1 family predicted Fe2+/Mn2+ transporter
LSALNTGVVDENIEPVAIDSDWLRVRDLAAAGAEPQTVLVAGIAAVVAGAFSMGGGEFVSVSAQRDSELAHGRSAATVNARPWAAAISSFVAFSAGAVLPLVAITGPWDGIRIPLTVAAVITALTLTGWWAAWAGKASIPKSIFRNVSISVLTMGFSYLIGSLLGVAIL